MPHEDGDAYAPVVATVTLGGHCVLDIYPQDQNKGKGKDKESMSASHYTDANDDADADADTDSTARQRPRDPTHHILQERLSLLITRGSAYKSYLHGIADIHRDTNLRKETIANWGLLGDTAEYESGSKERALRVSLTFRDVVKVSSVGSRLFGRGRGK